MAAERLCRDRVIVADADASTALEVAERIRGAVGRVKGNGRRRAGMRCSLGVATFPADADDAAGLVLAADRALYAAKRSGRDQVATEQDGLELAGEFLPSHTPVEAFGPDPR